MKIFLFFLGLFSFASAVNAQTDKWHLLWSDEFNYRGLPDESKWSYDTIGNSYGWGNHEDQWYTFRNSRNAYVSNGTLKITARRAVTNGKPYSSARLTSKNKGDWKYGRIVVRAKLPKGRGTWPAIWMLPSNNKYGGWPKSGEIDIMEHVGFSPDSVFSTAHTEAYNHVKGTQRGSSIMVPGATAGFHEYAIEWDEDEFRSYVDGKHYFTFKNEHSGSDAWPYDQPFHLLMNVAVGGGLGGRKGIDAAAFPQVMEVDYVRVYQKKEKK
jgi:beta-glucanase (GH16 family)